MRLKSLMFPSRLDEGDGGYVAAAATECGLLSAGGHWMALNHETDPIFERQRCIRRGAGASLQTPKGSIHTSPGQSPGSRVAEMQPCKGVTWAEQRRMCHPFRVGLAPVRTQGAALGWYAAPLRGASDSASVLLRSTVVFCIHW